MAVATDNVFWLKRGDRRPTLAVQLVDRDGEPADLTGAAVTFTMRPEGGGDLKVDAQPATVLDASTGEVEYAWAAVDVDTAGDFDAEFVATWTGAVTARFPNDGFIEVRIVPELADSEADEVLSLVTPEELESHMRQEFDSLATVVAGDLVHMAQSSLEAWLNRPVTVRAFSRDLRIRRLTEPRLYLPFSPVVSVQSVSIDGGAALVEETDYVVRPFGLDEFYAAGDVASVAWTAGYDGREREHSALRFAVLRAAKREMSHWIEDDAGLEEVRSEGYAAKFLAPEGMFTRQELSACLRYKRRVVR